MTNRRPKYLQDVDDVQDAIDELSREHDGVTMKMLTKHTKLSYGAVQQATVRLRNAQRITSERRSRVIYFFPK